MKNSRVLSILAASAILSLSSTHAMAELQFIESSGLGAYDIVKDTDNNIEWLVSRYTDNKSINESLSLYADDGWAVASYSQVYTFFTEGQKIGHLAFSNLFGLTYKSYGIGLHESDTGTGYKASLWGTGGSYTFSPNYYSTIFDENTISHNFSVFMYRTEESIKGSVNYANVNAPLFGLSLLGALGLPLLNRKKKKSTS